MAALTAPWIYGGGLLLLRVAALTWLVPSLGGERLPIRIRLTVVLAIVLVVDLGLGGIAVPVPDDALTLGLTALRELLVGGGLGLAVRLVFAALESAGAIAGISMALSLNTQIDPSSGEESTSLGALFGVTGALVFLAMDGHHVVVRALVAHAEAFPVGVLDYAPPSASRVAEALGELSLTALVLAAPAVVATLLVNLALAFVARLVPSMNLFAVGLGLLILSGLASLAFEGDAIVRAVDEATLDLPRAMESWSGTAR